MLTISSLCSGAGGIELAAEALFGPLEHLWFAEVDKDAAKVYSAHWPVPNLGDITAADWSAPDRPDILAGGPPCQGWSTAGKRLGSDDERDLWPVGKTGPDGTLRRGLLDALRELWPGLLLFENVASLVRAENGSAWSTILADLHGLGYAASWTTVGACKVGACHHRHRVYLAATLAEVPMPETAPLAWLDGASWFGTAGDLFGGFTSFADWPRAGLSVGGSVWPLPEDACGTSGIVLPTLRASDTGSAGRRAGHGWRPPLSQTVLGLLPTPTRADGERTSAVMVRGNPTLAGALLPTPTAAPYGNNQSPSVGASVRPSLESLVTLLPTPTVADSRGSRNATAGRGADAGDFGPGWTLSDVAHVDLLLPTPKARDTKGCDANPKGVGPGHAASAQGTPDLRTVAGFLPTPRATDATKGGPNQAGSSGDLMLPSAVQPGRFGDYEAAVRRHELLLGGPAPEPTEPGKKGQPRLTAAFPEWMCGFRAGWITDHAARPAAIRIVGNSVVWQAATYAYSTLPTLLAHLAAAVTG